MGIAHHIAASIAAASAAVNGFALAQVSAPPVERVVGTTGSEADLRAHLQAEQAESLRQAANGVSAVTVKGSEVVLRSEGERVFVTDAAGVRTELRPDTMTQIVVTQKGPDGVEVAKSVGVILKMNDFPRDPKKNPEGLTTSEILSDRGERLAYTSGPLGSNPRFSATRIDLEMKAPKSYANVLQASEARIDQTGPAAWAISVARVVRGPAVDGVAPILGLREEQVPLKRGEITDVSVGGVRYSFTIDERSFPKFGESQLVLCCNDKTVGPLWIGKTDHVRSVGSLVLDLNKFTPAEAAPPQSSR